MSYAIGHSMSLEVRAKISAFQKGRIRSADTRAKMSAAAMRRPPMSLETRAKDSVGHIGKVESAEHRAKISAGVKKTAVYGLVGPLSRNWKGGKKVWMHRQNAKRRSLGFTPLNEWFVGCEAHHLDPELVIYMPKKLHRSIYHRQSDGMGMAKINAEAYNYLFKQEVEVAMGGLRT